MPSYTDFEDNLDQPKKKLKSTVRDAVMAVRKQTAKLRDVAVVKKRPRRVELPRTVGSDDSQADEFDSGDESAFAPRAPKNSKNALAM